MPISTSLFCYVAMGPFLFALADGINLGIYDIRVLLSHCDIHERRSPDYHYDTCQRSQDERNRVHRYRDQTK
jgi:hypothetical protein